MSAIQGRKYSNRMQAETAKHGQEADMAHRIYYIEDDAGIAEGVAFFLRRKGFEAVSYTHLDVYKRQPFMFQMEKIHMLPE